MAVLTVLFLLVALVFAIEVDEEAMYKGYRAVTYAIMSVTSAVLLRHFED